MKNKILLLYVNVLVDANIPLGPSMISSTLKQKYEVRLFDTTFYLNESIKIEEKRVEWLEHKKLTEELPSLNTTNVYEDFEKLYNEFKPDLIAVSVTSIDYKLALNLIKNVNVPVLFGGVHSTVAPEDLITHPKVTHVFRGEAEDAILELVDKILSKQSLKGFKGVWYKENGEIIKNESILFVKDLSTLPMPDWGIFDERHFYRPFEGKIYRMGNYALSRGCPYFCSYCINHIYQRYDEGGYRTVPLDKAFEEIKQLAKEHNVQIMKFWDDNFLGSQSNSKKFLERYPQEIGLPFTMQTRPETLTEEFAQLLKKANCIAISMSIESGNERIRRNILNRHVKNEDIIKGFQLCKKYGLRTTTGILIGLPEETKKEFFETIELVKKCQPTSINTSLLQPFKGTKIREWCVKHKWLEEKDDCVGNIIFSYQLKNPHFTKKELLNFKKLFSIYAHTDSKYHSIIEKAGEDELFYSFLKEVYAKIIHPSSQIIKCNKTNTNHLDIP
ncbi:B12-binding domain-containing radical SAM protein [Patescibacteria group bacterium]|nr:B12-binding domain-containing radical SAM protein [Patescibacteria group bacterium]